MLRAPSSTAHLEIHQLLHTKCMAFLRALHHDSCADDVSSRGDVEQQVLAGNGAVRIGGDWR
jgi:hypothetical protein